MATPETNKRHHPTGTKSESSSLSANTLNRLQPKSDPRSVEEIAEGIEQRLNQPPSFERHREEVALSKICAEAFRRKAERSND